jgi:uncharacterized protein YaaR (DUF327 family)
MAKIEADPSVFMTPSAYTRVKNEKKTEDSKRGGKTRFSPIFDDITGKSDTGPLGLPPNLPVSEETLNLLMDGVRSAGDSLRERPFPDEILLYKKAVRDFMHYVVKNCYSLDHVAGIQKFEKPGYKGPLWDSEAKKRLVYTKIEGIDKKLEDLAAMLLSGQTRQLEIASRLEEIKGLLVDLME